MFLIPTGSFLPFDVEECYRYLKLVTHSIRRNALDLSVENDEQNSVKRENVLEFTVIRQIIVIMYLDMFRCREKQQLTTTTV